MTVLLDNGHGYDTAGKRSTPEMGVETLYEFEFNRDIVSRTMVGLAKKNIKAVCLVPEYWDVPLHVRVQRANKFKNAFLVSVHANAGRGTGFECFTSIGQSKADRLATIFYQEAEKLLTPYGFPMRTDFSDGDHDKEARFTILTRTLCPAVLTENMFMDTKKDYEFIKSIEGRKIIAEYHINSIYRYVKENNK